MAKGLWRIGVPAYLVEGAVDADNTEIGRVWAPLAESLGSARAAAVQVATDLRERLLVRWDADERRYEVAWFLDDADDFGDCRRCDGYGRVPCSHPQCGDPGHEGTCPQCYGSARLPYPAGVLPVVDLWETVRA